MASESRGIVTADGCLFCIINSTSQEACKVFPSLPSLPYLFSLERKEKKQKERSKEK